MASQLAAAPPSPSLVRALAQQALRLARVDLREAEGTADAACVAAAALDDPTSSGLAQRSLGHVRYLSGRLQEAVELYERAIDAFCGGGDELEAAKTRSSALQALILLGRYGDAERFASEAREVLLRHGDALPIARLDCNVANMLHRLDRHREALEVYERSLRVFRENGVDPEATAAALLNSAVCLIILGDLALALSRFEEVSVHCRAHDMPLPALQAEYNVAYLHYHRGEYARAIELYRDGVVRSREQGDPYHEALCTLDLAEIYLEVNLTDEGALLAERARAAFSTLGLRYETSKASTFMAIAASQRGELDRAAALFEEARRGFDDEGNHAWTGMVDFYRAIVLLEMGRPEEARRQAARARDGFVEGGQAPRIVLAELLLARAELHLGAVGRARDGVEAARARLEDLDLPHLAYQTLFVEGLVAEAAGDRHEALERYRGACEVLGGLRSHLHSEELKIAFVKNKQEVYESLIWLSLEGGARTEEEAEAVFAWVESAKSRALTDLIAPRVPAPRPSRPDPDGLEGEMRRLREELNWCYSQLDRAELEPRGAPAAAGPLLGRGVAPGAPAQLRRRAKELEDRLTRIMTNLRTRDLDLASLQAGDSVSLEAMRAALPADAVLLEYYEARGTVFGFVVGHDRILVMPVTTSDRVRRLLGFLQFQLSKLELGEEYERTFAAPLLAATRGHLRELYDELVAPLRSSLRARSLVVVPHGSLHHVPFHALWDGEAYLVDHFSLSYAPSAGTFERCSTRPRAPSTGALVLAVPDPWNPGIAAEASAVAAAVPGAVVLLGEDATAAALRAQGASARILHIAAHGFFRRDNPMFSAIQLGGSRLTVFDLYSLDLAAEVVVLSGCGTGLAVVERGDELIGLVRGLLYAGAQTVVATLWDAQDESTARFMEAFYRHLPRSSDRAGALRQAMIEVREARPHPFYWAPFFLAGRVSP
ncbi:MAG TPA: CHAT domain-containing tetratricopeptide repeat protein [Thermoanaerobaculia bacterium]|nr:CHAT domain-containing tetratricopeptide repeat protein [Thermoanaerobaculia bacterium]